MDVGPELLLALRELQAPGPVGDRVIVDERQRGERLPCVRRTELRVEREQFEENRRPRPGRADHEDRRFDRLGEDLRRSVPRVLQAEPGTKDAQHLAARDHASEQVETGFGVDGAQQPAVRLVPPRPVALARVGSSGAGARDREQLFGIELDDRPRVPGDIAEEIEATDPLRVHELLHDA